MGKSRFFPEGLHPVSFDPYPLSYVLVHRILTEQGYHFHGVLLSWSPDTTDGLPVVIGTVVRGVKQDCVGHLEIEAYAA